MTGTLHRTLLAMCVAATAAACASSPPTRFVTLDAAPGPPRAARASGLPVALGKVTLPPELDRAHPVRREGHSSLDIPMGVRWAAPLDELVHRTLALDLASRLPKGEAVLPGQAEPSGPMRLVVVTFRTFSADSAGTVTLDAHWSSVEQPSGRIEISRDATVTVPAHSMSWDDVAGAMSEALARLADRIASSLPEGQAPAGSYR
ncbi:MAG: PqiC family protein [Gemmatimonadetes bacterium]|nr:PqiC family protein [Gemmatimonadota bacterium]